MADRVVFDVIGTLFSLDAAERELDEAGAPPGTTQLWFAESLRDFFAASHAGMYVPLGRVMQSALARRLAALGLDASAGDVFPALRKLDPVPGAAAACDAFAAAGWTIVALTNGGEDFIRALLERGGLAHHFESIVSCDSLGVSKPHPNVYGAVSGDAGATIWMVAAHGWDVMGAARAGMRTAWISTPEGLYPELFPRPDVVAPDIAAAASAILGE